LNEFHLLKRSFRKEKNVLFGIVSDVDLRQQLSTFCLNHQHFNRHNQQTYDNHYDDGIFLLKPGKIDRSCLLIENEPMECLKFESNSLFEQHNNNILSNKNDQNNGYSNVTIEPKLSALLNFVNVGCGLHRNLNGEKNQHGLLLEEIEKKKFAVGTMNDDGGNNYESRSCEVVDSVPATQAEFFGEFVARSKPAVFRGAAKRLAPTAFENWTIERLRNIAGNRTVWVKANPSAEFEGVESIELWKNVGGPGSSLPDSVAAKLSSPDLITVRPADVNMTINELLDAIQGFIPKRLPQNANYYFEYAKLDLLKDDMPKTIPFAEFLKLEHFNTWLGDGSTVGKTHFDEFENLLFQMSGEKKFTVFSPEFRANMYEQHLREGRFEVRGDRVERAELLDSTSMVMSPVDVQRANLTRFPLFDDVTALVCDVREGDLLYLPSFWWHLVESVPSSDPRKPPNLAVNYWFSPFWTSEFPCAECTWHINTEQYESTLFEFQHAL